MRGIVITPPADPAGPDYPAWGCRATGPAAGARLDLGDFPLWAVRGRLGPGSALQWLDAGDGHGDQALYLLEGELQLEDRVCPEGGAIVVESGAPARAVATRGAEVVHFGPRFPGPRTESLLGPPDPSGHGVHVLGPGAMYAAAEPGRDTRVFADGTCERCRLFLLLTGRDFEYVSSPHSHSADEILFVLRGEIRFGRQAVGPGQAVAISANRQYAFRSGPAGFAFLNYRADASEQTVGREPPKLEGGRARGLPFVGDVR